MYCSCFFQHDFRVHQTDDESREGAADDEDDGDDDEDKSASQTDIYSNKILSQEPSDSTVVADSSDKLVVDISDIDSCKYLQIASLNEWDYPIFEAASSHSNCILSKVSYTIILFKKFQIVKSNFNSRK